MFFNILRLVRKVQAFTLHACMYNDIIKFSNVKYSYQNSQICGILITGTSTDTVEPKFIHHNNNYRYTHTHEKPRAELYYLSTVLRKNEWTY